MQLLPIPRVDPDRLALLIRDLDSAEFAVRDRASQQLGLMADSAEPATGAVKLRLVVETDVLIAVQLRAAMPDASIATPILYA